MVGMLLRAPGVQAQLHRALMRPASPVASSLSRGLSAAAAAAAAAATATGSASAPAASAAARGCAAATGGAAAAAAVRPGGSSRAVLAAASAAAAAPALQAQQPPALLMLRSLAEQRGPPTQQQLLLSLASRLQQQQGAAPAALAALARRCLSTTSSSRWAAAAAEQPQPKKPAASASAAAAAAKQAQEAVDETSLELTEEKMRAITDKIPQRPVGVVEGASYTALIAAAFAVLIFFAYNFAATFLFEPAATACFNAAVQRLRADPRITVRLGADITAYGQESASRAARQAVPHVMYTDASGVEHCRLQFHLRGAGGAVAVVNADMYKGGADGGGSAWEYSYLIADVSTPGGGPGGTRPQQQRLVIVAPR